VHAGEIFGIAGVAGNGQAELVEVLFGLRAISSGRITVGSTDIRGLGPGRLRRHAVAYIPGERAVRGAALQGTIWENLTADRLGDFRRVLLLDFQAIRGFSDEQIRKFSIRSAHWKLPAQSLSGGNLQKLVLSRELRREVDVLLVEEPARGLDIQSADQVLREILRMRAQGSAVVLVSSDLNELMRLADRIAVMYRGRIQAILDNTEGLSSYQIGEYMMGLRTA
jgi:ABC-type uncharacterized transport system ATPase subunit